MAKPMHKIILSDVNHTEKSLTQAILQVSQFLGMYDAELARILGLRCGDIGDFYKANKTLQANSNEWLMAEKYIAIYQGLFVKFQGNDVKINNWLRRNSRRLKGVPLYLMVDEKRLDDVLNVLN